MKNTASLSSNPASHVDNFKGPLGLTLLYSPPEPDIDFIFVHGLGGGSRKTWSKSPQQAHYWPQEWLPKDPEFKNVRIHSYGYDSDYLKGKDDCLNIHHFGKLLLVALSTSPCLVDSETHIVAIGHSMGGLVIKEAYILAKQDPQLRSVSGRFAAIYFLATPHRGADSAKTLRNILKFAYDRLYIADLERNSVAIQVINDAFRHFSADLELWSFYETQNMSFLSSPIVDPESAVLGYREERQVPMAADHRLICKFETPQDASYTLLRNALASTVRNITSAVPMLKLKKNHDRLRDLKEYLEISDTLNEDLLCACEARMHESCQWLPTKASYVRWREGDSANDRTLWIRGKPATGKSVLAGYIVDHLRDALQGCSCFFFKHGDKSKSSLGRCLRSLAFQMASSNIESLDTILKMQEEGIRLDHVDERTLWRTLFLSRIFRAPMTRHYWVIDALDECSNPSFLLDTMIPRLDESVPLRILITSRNTSDLDQGFSHIPPNLIQSLSMSTADTQQDIKLLIARTIEAVEIIGSEELAPLAENILAKSKGSFLWTILVLREVLRCHSKKEINQILEEVPRGMEPLYKRTLELILQGSQNKNLAKAILTWTTCAVRPMTISELHGALTLDMEDTYPKLEETIDILCGQLVVVDSFGRVQMVHETAREYLLAGKSDSELFIDRATAHTRMANVCLTYLVGKELKPPRATRRRSLADVLAKRQDFATYAYTAYSYHLAKADPLAAKTLQLVEQFFRANVLAWIEAIAESRNLNQLVRASKHLKTYINACTIERSPLDPRIRTLRQWTTDLARLPAMFANAFIAFPSAIYWLIPPFCPTESAIYDVSNPGRKLAVLGASNKQWDDRLLCIDFRHGQPSALCYGEDFLAVSLTTGAVALYYASSHQEYKVLEHGESIKFISFKNKTNLMATCGLRMVKVWDIRSGEVMHSLKSPSRPLAMDFDEDRLLVASHRNYIACWSLGRNIQPEPAQRPWSNVPETGCGPPRGTPYALALSVNQGMLAVAYNTQPIALWDMEEDAYVGCCGKKLSNGETSTHIVVALAFNPNPDIGLLAAAYLDGDLALLDPFADQQLECFRADCQTLAPSPDGRLLAAGGADGMIYIYEFDSFKLLYRVKSSNSYIKQLSFARDSLRLADIRGAQCTVWEPETLLRRSLSDDSSGPTTTSTSTVEIVSVEAKAKITAMVVHPTAEVIFCAKDDGSVVLYDRKTAASLRTLCTHKSPVRLLAWCERRAALLSFDGSNRIFLHGIQKSPNQGWLADVTVAFKSYLESEKAIIDVLVGDTADKFVVSTRDCDHMFTLGSGEHERERADPYIAGFRKWVCHPQSPLHLVCIYDTKICIYSWVDWSEARALSLQLDDDLLQLKKATFCSLGQRQRVILESSARNGSTSTNKITIFDMEHAFSGVDNSQSLPENRSDDAAASSQSISDQETVAAIMIPPPVAPFEPELTTFAPNIAHVIGLNDSGRIIFLDRSSWVCTAVLSEAGLTFEQGQGSPMIFRHFFVPYDWFAGRRDLVCALAQGDIMLSRGGDLAVIKNGFQLEERVLVE